jgi:uncharacterized membrane protein
MNEPKIRSLVKTLTWRVTGSASTAVISYVMTGSLALASSIAGVQIVVNMALYYAHERLWAAIEWKKKE